MQKYSERIMKEHKHSIFSNKLFIEGRRNCVLTREYEVYSYANKVQIAHEAEQDANVQQNSQRNERKMRAREHCVQLAEFSPGPYMS